MGLSPSKLSGGEYSWKVLIMSKVVDSVSLIDVLLLTLLVVVHLFESPIKTSEEFLLTGFEVLPIFD